ncbi:MAG: hypothetical protein ACJ72N_19800 [Labedaea sp.]
MAVPTQDFQVSVAGLLLGPATSYTLVDFNPWGKANRATQTDKRAWAHGSWSGRELIDEVVIPIRALINTETPADFLAARHQLAAAFKPSDDGTDAELRFRFAGQDYVMFGRPRMVDLENPELLVLGKSFVKAAFVALDPLIYAATEMQQVLGLPSVSGGLTAPVTAPVTIGATVTAGRATIANAGTQATALKLRIDPVGANLVEPRVSVLTGTTVRVLRCNLTLTAGQWMDIDTGARTAYLNGTVSRRGNVSGDWPLVPPMSEGSSELAFDAGVYSASAQLTATWRDAWI